MNKKSITRLESLTTTRYTYVSFNVKYLCPKDKRLVSKCHFYG